MEDQSGPMDWRCLGYQSKFYDEVEDHANSVYRCLMGLASLRKNADEVTISEIQIPPLKVSEECTRKLAGNLLIIMGDYNAALKRMEKLEKDHDELRWRLDGLKK